jgi:hypothetical protein
MLYRNNSFDFESLATVFKLSLTILPERMQMIKLVQWRYAWPITGFWPGSLNPAIASFERKGTQTLGLHVAVLIRPALALRVCPQMYLLIRWYDFPYFKILQR